MRLPKPCNALAVLALICTTFVASAAMAHLMPAGKGTINVLGSKAYIVLSLPVAAFSGDRFQAEQLSSLELKQSEMVLRDRVRAAIHVSSGGEPAAFDQVLLNLPSVEGHGDDHGHGEELIVMIVAQFASPPGRVTLASDLWADDTSSLSIKATVSDGPKTLRSEIGAISKNQREVQFFASPLESPTSSPPHGFFQPGGGFERGVLLFLIAFGVAGGGWAAWMSRNTPS